MEREPVCVETNLTEIGLKKDAQELLDGICYPGDDFVLGLGQGFHHRVDSWLEGLMEVKTEKHDKEIWSVVKLLEKHLPEEKRYLAGYIWGLQEEKATFALNLAFHFGTRISKVASLLNEIAEISEIQSEYEYGQLESEGH